MSVAPGPVGRGAAVLAAAKEAVEAAVRGHAAPSWRLPALEAWGASFVTLERRGALRGCIGTLEARRPLIDDVRANAEAAALRDPRFPPMSTAELGGIDIEVAVLDAPSPLAATSETEARALLCVGRDGVILAHRERRATFLPKVWEQLPDPAAFLAALKRKAGLPEAHWDDEVRLWRYGVTAWRA